MADVPPAFLNRFGDSITGILSGFDRLRRKGGAKQQSSGGGDKAPIRASSGAELMARVRAKRRRAAALQDAGAHAGRPPFAPAVLESLPRTWQGQDQGGGFLTQRRKGAKILKMWGYFNGQPPWSAMRTSIHVGKMPLLTELKNYFGAGWLQICRTYGAEKLWWVARLGQSGRRCYVSAGAWGERRRARWSCSWRSAAWKMEGSTKKAARVRWLHCSYRKVSRAAFRSLRVR